MAGLLLPVEATTAEGPPKRPSRQALTGSDVCGGGRERSRGARLVSLDKLGNVRTQRSLGFAHRERYEPESTTMQG